MAQRLGNRRTVIPQFYATIGTPSSSSGAQEPQTKPPEGCHHVHWDGDGDQFHITWYVSGIKLTSPPPNLENSQLRTEVNILTPKRVSGGGGGEDVNLVL